MKLLYLDRTSLGDSSFRSNLFVGPHFIKEWHYHPELELVLVQKSSGTRFIGDHVGRFDENELILMGENLPHKYRNDEDYFLENNNLEAMAYAVHFKQDLLGNSFNKMPELAHIGEMIGLSKLGIKFEGVAPEILQMIKELRSLEPANRLIQLLVILDYLARHKDFQVLSSEGFINSFSMSYKSLDMVYEFIFENFDKQITLPEVAEIAYMNPSSFSRFFKRVNGKTFRDYLTEVRVGYACRLLAEKKYNITRIGYEAGFNNISNFNRRFKAITGQTPTQYSKKYQI
ncbi:AraC family transcriptional regulator [Flagellimonas sp. 2504JD4-2]